MNVYQNAIGKQVEKDLAILGRNIIGNEINESTGSLEKLLVLTRMESFIFY